MKILATLLYYHPHWTGLTAYAKRISEGLQARGHSVTVLTAQYLPELPREEEIGGVRVVRLPTQARISRGMLMPDLPKMAAQLIASHDIVHVHTPMLETALMTGLARAQGKASLVTHHGDLVMPAGLFNRAVQVAVVNAMHAGLRMADHITIHSADYARNSAFLRPYADKTTPIYPPADIPDPDASAVADWRRDLGLEGKQIVGFAGRFVEEKGFDFLLQAIPSVRARCPNVHFLFAGEVNVVYEQFFQRWQHLFQTHREVLTPLGLITDPQKLANFYALCDLFALPSRTDCFPSVQIEALLCGTPLVTSDIPGAREVVQRTGFGRLVTPRDPQALADGIVEVLNHPQRYQPDYAAVREVFHLPQTVSAYENLIHDLVERSPAQRKLHPLPPPRQYTSLNRADLHKIGALMRNEADMAYRRRAPTLLDFLELKDGERVLDCGCGMGVYMMLMGRLRQVSVFGVDGDVARLQWAERENPSAHLSSVDIHQLPFADNSFDKIIMSEVLEHLSDDRRAMQEIYRVLKPGGILALSVPHANYPFLWDPINKVLEWIGAEPIRKPGLITGIWSNHERLYRPEQLAEVITGGGLEIENLEEQTHYAFPFIHLIVYSVGKPLIELNLLPQNLRNAADRFRGEQNSGSLLNPINLGVSLLRLADEPNNQLNGSEQTFVTIVVKAQKPLYPNPSTL